MQIGGGPGFDAEHQNRLEKLLTEIEMRSRPQWHQSWWGMLVVGTLAGAIGGVAVVVLQRFV